MTLIASGNLPGRTRLAALWVAGIAAALVCGMTPNAAAQDTAQGVDTPLQPGEGTDLTGSNPLLFLPTLTLKNEFQHVRSGSRQNITTIGYAQPVQDSKANVRLNIPLVYNNLSGKDRFGLGDLALKYTFLPMVELNGKVPVSGVFVGVEGVFKTASHSALGRGKYILQTQAGYARFLPKGRILAPAAQYNVSLGGDRDRPNVSELLFDIYMVQNFGGKTAAVLTLDPQFGFDFKNDNHFIGLFEASYQFSPSKPGHNLYIRPGVGIGKYRPYDWNIEVGYSIVGFGL